MTTLGNAPGGAELIDSLTGAIETLALLYSGTDDDRASAHLESYITKIKPSITEAVGADTAARMLDVFRCTVLGEKRRLESNGASRA
jgi:hypothetical protein